MFIEPKDTVMTPELMQEYITKHQQECLWRYDWLKRYYNGGHDILKEPKKDSYKPDNRLIVNLPKYIADTMNGFFIGIPIKVSHENEEIAAYLEFLDQYNDQDDNNAELSKICSIYGSGLELLFNDEEGEIGITYLTPMEGFIIYDDSILHRPMFGVRYYVDEDNVLRGSWSDKFYVQHFRRDGKIIWEDEPTEHYFGDVPLIEYVENEERQSIFEPVISLVDGYNKALSEKANDVDYYADAYLSILGAKLDEDTLRHLRDSRIINLSGEDTDKIIVQFLQKPDADGTQENLIDRLERLIFQISMVANINDENFGTSSGIALKYKLQSMSNLAKTKERKFTSGMNRRYKMIAHNPASKMHEDDWLKIKYTFTRNFPANLLEESQIAGNLSGITSRETQLSVLSCVDNIKGELEKIEEEEDNGQGGYNNLTGGGKDAAETILGAAQGTDVSAVGEGRAGVK